MKASRFAAVLAVLLAIAPRAHAAAGTPNFSGTWMLVSGPQAPSMPLGASGIVTQDASSIAFTSLGRTQRYRLDGGVTTAMSSRGDGAEGQVRWVQNALTVTVKHSGSFGVWEDLMVCSLDADGRLNVVNVSTPIDDAVAQAMKTTVSVYTRQ